MKVELSIADDRELRAHIKDVIKGEVLSIARGEIKGIIAQAVTEKAIPRTPEELDCIITKVIKEEIKNVISRGYGRPNYIQELISAEVKKHLAKFFSKARQMLP